MWFQWLWGFAMKVVLVAVVIFGLATGAGAVTLVNGSFEDVVLSTPADPVAVGGGQLGGWTVGHGGVGLMGPALGASHGIRSAHLHGGPGGTLSQTVTGLALGDRYELAFDFRGGTGADPLSRVIFAMLLTPGVSYHLAGVDETGPLTRGFGWTRVLFYFDAGAADLTLSFYTPYRGDEGVLVDNVRLGVAPIPPALPLLATALGGLMLLRRSRGQHG